MYLPQLDTNLNLKNGLLRFIDMNFSVIISIYKNDSPNAFSDALESVTTGQTLKPKQLILVEDGPVSDLIDEIFKKCQHNNPGIAFDIIKKEKNEGLAAALNDAIDLCCYDWIARMDSDDISDPDRFKKQVDYLVAHPEVSVLGGVIEEFANAIGDISSKRTVPLDNESIVQMARTRNPMNHMTVFMKKSAVLSVGKYSVSFGKLEDYKLWVDLIGKGYRFANLDSTLVYVRVGNGFIDRRSNRREIQDWDMLQKYLIRNGMIGKGKALRNMFYIRTFTYMPRWMKRLVYSYALRKK